MRKCIKLADKIKILTLAVLVACSTFFYAPMDVNAADINQSLNGSVDLSGIYYQYRQVYETPNILFADYYDGSVSSDSLYRVSFDVPMSFKTDTACYIQQLFSRLGSSYLVTYYGSYYCQSSNNFTYDNRTVNRVYYMTGSELNTPTSLHTSFIVRKTSDAIVNITGSANISNISVEIVSNADSSDYQNGYDAGFSAGQDIGYSNGFSDGFSEGEQSGFENGFQSGKDSVDTQSYYDAGYQAGYDIAFALGYDSGYDSGYNDAMSRVDSWGADTSDYPILVFDESVSQPRVHVQCMSNIPGTSYGSTSLFHLDFNVNPNHTYKFVFDSEGFYSDTYNCLFGDKDLVYVVGNLRIPASYKFSWGSNTVFIPGDCFSTVVELDAYVYEMRYYGGVNESNDLDLAIGEVLFGTHGNVSLKVYDMGPSGDTQNHIANQTDKLTNGYDDSQGSSVNDTFETSINDFSETEDSLWGSATTGLNDFVFFDFASVPAMITGLSFITAIMTSWFNYAGGASGVGIVLSILFSIMLVAMALGLYRWYQSKGGKGD